MKAKKRERVLAVPVEQPKSQFEHLQTDHDLFLQAFESTKV